MGLLNSLGNYTSTESGFIKASLVGIGIPAAGLGAWAFKGDDATSVMVIPVAFISAYVWGKCMWVMMFRDLYARKRELAAKAKGTATGDGNA